MFDFKYLWNNFFIYINIYFIVWVSLFFLNIKKAKNSQTKQDFISLMENGYVLSGHWNVFKISYSIK